MRGFRAMAATLVLLLAATTGAATVSLETTQCLQPITIEKFEIETGRVNVKEFAICGLKIVSSSADVNALSCRAFKDTAGQVPGSAVFTFAQPASIGTNPRQIGSIRCDVANNNTGGGNNGTAVANPPATSRALPAGNTTITVPTPSSQTSSMGTGTGTGTSGQTLAPSGAAEKVQLSVSAVIAAAAVYLL